MAGNGTSIKLFDSRSCTGERSNCTTLTVAIVLGQALTVTLPLLDALTRVEEAEFMHYYISPAQLADLKSCRET